MDITGICITAILSAAASLSLKKYSPEIAALTAIAGGIIIACYLFLYAMPYMDRINSVISSSGIDTTYIPVLIKSVGICALCQFTADHCRDAGQSALASKVEFAARMAVIFISLPMFEEILLAAGSILK